MPISGLTNPLAMSFLQQFIRRVPPQGDTGEVGGSFSFIPPPIAPPNNMILSSPLPGGATTLNDMIQGTFTLPGNRGIQTQLLRMLGDALQFNKPGIQFPGFGVPRFERFP